MNEQTKPGKTPPATLSLLQQQLADAFATTLVKGKVIRRYPTKSGSVKFREYSRKIHIIDFSKHPGEFIFKHHEKDPQAPSSPIMVNMRNIPEGLLRQIALILNEIPREEVSFVTGIPRAGVPLAQKFSEVSRIPFVDILQKTGRATERSIQAKANKINYRGQKLLIVDDLITKGGSKLEAIHAAETVGFEVVGIMVLIDRQQGGKQLLESQGYKVYTSIKLTEMLDYYLQSGRLSADKYREVIDYLKQNG
jgi:orotate phosphoribosyltransferase